jgi:hypothetical protein
MNQYDDDGALLRDLRKPRHYTIDNEFLDDGYAAEIGTYAAMAYNVICRHANFNTKKSFPSAATISKKTGMSIRKAKQAVYTLEKYRLVSVEHNIGRGHKNVYSLLDLSEWVVINSASCAPIKPQEGISAQHAPINTLNSAYDDTLNSAPCAPEQTNIEQTKEVVVVSPLPPRGNIRSTPIQNFVHDSEILPDQPSEKPQQQLSSISSFKAKKRSWTDAEKEAHRLKLEQQRQQLEEKTA